MKLPVKLLFSAGHNNDGSQLLRMTDLIDRAGPLTGMPKRRKSSQILTQIAYAQFSIMSILLFGTPACGRMAGVRDKRVGQPAARHSLEILLYIGYPTLNFHTWENPLSQMTGLLLYQIL